MNMCDSCTEKIADFELDHKPPCYITLAPAASPSTNWLLANCLVYQHAEWRGFKPRVPMGKSSHIPIPPGFA